MSFAGGVHWGGRETLLVQSLVWSDGAVALLCLGFGSHEVFLRSHGTMCHSTNPSPPSVSPISLTVLHKCLISHLPVYVVIRVIFFFGLHDLQQKKNLTRPDGFFCYAHLQRKRKITQLTAKIKKLHDWAIFSYTRLPQK